MSARRLLIALLLALPLRAAIAPAASDVVVELPPFVITESPTSEKAWRYAEAEGFEIISQVDDATVQQIFAALWRGQKRCGLPMLVGCSEHAELQVAETYGRTPL